ncbi:hypothetical protein Aperf_G00000126929 [Anoplocephala perfoliata]
MEDTKIIYHIDDENTPYLVKLSVNADKVTLGDFKAALNRPNYKFFFKSVDADFGNKTGHFHEETERNSNSNKGDNANDNRDECETCGDSESACSGSRLGKIGRGNQSIYDTSSSMLSSDLESTSFFDSEDESSRFSTATGTTVSSMRYGAHRQRRRRRFMPISRISEDASSYSSMTDSTMSLNIVTVTLKMDTVNYLGISIVGQSNRAGDGGIYVGSIMRGGAVALDGRIEPGDMLLEVNGISFEDMSNDDAVRVLREQVQKPGPITLVVAKCWDPNPRTGCFVLSRQEPVRPIDPRAWVLHTNAMTAAAAGNVPQISNLHADGLTGMSDSNSPAFCGNYPMSTGGVIGSGAAKVMLPMSKSNASGSSVTAKSGPDSTATAGGGSGAAGPSFMSHQHSQVGSNQAPSEMVSVEEKSQQLTVATDMALVVRAMLLPDSGLEIHDRTWLKISISNAVIGSDLVDWLFAHVVGFNDRREVRKYASNMLKCGYIQHTVNKNTFSEQCYYVFSDFAGTVMLNLEEMDSVSEIGGTTRHLGGMMPVKNGAAGSSSVSSFVRSLPPTGFSGVSAATTTATAGAASGVAFWQTQPGAPMFGGPVNSQQVPPPPPPPAHQHMVGMIPVSAVEMQSSDIKGLMATQQQQQRQNVVGDDASSSAGSSSSTSTSSSSSSCSSTARQPSPPPPPSQQSHSIDTVAPSVHSVTPCSCINLRRRRRNPKESSTPASISQSRNPASDNHSAASTVTNRFAEFAEENHPSSAPGSAADGTPSEPRGARLLGVGPNAIMDSPVLSGAVGRGPATLPPPPTQPSPLTSPQLPSCAVAASSNSDHSQHSQQRMS